MTIFLLAAMLRSVDVPAKLVMGDTSYVTHIETMHGMKCL